MTDFQTYLIIILTGLAVKLSYVTSFSISLDQAHDEDPLMWTINGDVEYLESGKTLQPAFSEYLPKGFYYPNVKLTEGIWVIVPNIKKDCHVNNDDSLGSPELEWSDEKDTSKEKADSEEAGQEIPNDASSEHIEGPANFTTASTKRPTSTEHSSHTISNHSNEIFKDGNWKSFRGNQLSNNSSEGDESAENEIFYNHTEAANSNSTRKILSKRSVEFCDISNSASFKFTFQSQLADSVRVRYLFGGANATIRIFDDGIRPLLELKSKKRNLDKWIETPSQLNGRGMTLEASVGEKGDYILIDSITINTLEPTTSTTTTKKPTQSTTVPTTKLTEPTSPSPRPEPAPVSGQQGVLYLKPAKFIIFICILLVVQNLPL